MSQLSIMAVYAALGYSDSTFGLDGKAGLCNGVTLRWLEACMLGEEHIFDARLKTISTLDNTNTISKINAAIQAGKPLTSEDLNGHDVHDILSFYDSLDLYQFPQNSASLFDAIHTQTDFEPISQLASSEKMQERGGLKKISEKSMIYNEDEIKAYLDEVARAIEDSGATPDESVGVNLFNRYHFTGLIYTPTKGWKYMDIELYPPKTGTSQEIAAEICKSFKRVSPNHSGSNYALTTSVIVPANHTKSVALTANLETVNNKQVVTQEIASRKEVVNLAWIAARQGDIKTIQALVQAGGSDFNATDNEGLTPVYIAAQNGHSHIIEELQKAGANVSQKNKANISPLQIAAQMGQAQAMEALFRAGATDSVTDNGRTAAHFAAIAGHVNIIKVLQDAGCNLELATNDGYTPLFFAVQKGHAPFVKALAEAGCNLDTTLKDGVTPLFIAAQNGHTDIVKTLLMHKAKSDIPFITTTDNLNRFAEMHGNDVKARMKRMINHQFKNGATAGAIPLRANDIAWIMGHEGILEEIAKNNSQLGNTSSQFVVPDELPEITNLESLVKSMLLVPEDKRLNTLKVQDENQSTALHNALDKPDDFMQILKLIPQDKCSEAIRITNGDNDTVLHIAIYYPETLKLILDHTPPEQRLAAISATDGSKNSVLLAALRRPEAFKLLLESLPPEEVFAAISMTRYGDTVLHSAIEHPERFKLILERLPPEQRLDAVMLKSYNGNTVAKAAASDPELLQEIITLLPEYDWSKYIENGTLEKHSSHLNSEKPPIEPIPETNNHVSMKDSHSAIQEKTQSDINPSHKEKCIDFKQQLRNMKPSAPNDPMQQIQKELSDLIKKLEPTKDVWYMDSSTPKINALQQLSNLLENKDNCWSDMGIEPKTYGDILDYWGKQKQFSNANGEKVSNLELVDLKRNIFAKQLDTMGTPTGDAIKLLIETHKTKELPQLEEQANNKQSIKL